MGEMPTYWNVIGRALVLHGRALLMIPGTLLTAPFVLMAGRDAAVNWHANLMRWADQWKEEHDALCRDLDRLENEES